jgi:hypothetical protein
MTALKFYFPSNGEDDDQDQILEDLWNQGTMSYLIFTRRMSHRGNPYIKGVFILENDNTPPPYELECIPLSEDHIHPLVNEFREELLMKNNGVELGSPN